MEFKGTLCWDALDITCRDGGIRGQAESGSLCLECSHNLLPKVGTFENEGEGPMSIRVESQL